MAGTAHTHVQMAARVVWKPTIAGKAAFRPFQSRQLLRSATCRTKAVSGDLQLVRREGEAHIVGDAASSMHEINFVRFQFAVG